MPIWTRSRRSCPVRTDLDRRFELVPVGLVLLALLTLSPALADERTLAIDVHDPAVLGDVPGDDDCDDGVVYDDGSTEIGWGWVPSVLDGRYVQEFQSADFPLRTVETVCVCFRRSTNFPNGGDDTIDFEVVFYRSVPTPDPDSPETFERVPAEEPFLSIPATATGVPEGSGVFTGVDVGDVTIPLGTSYIGVRWDATIDQFFFTCADTTETTEPVNGYFREEQASGWTSFFKAQDPNFQFHRALLVRARPGTTLPVEVPTLGTAGMAVLLMLLVGLGWRRITNG